MTVENYRRMTPCIVAMQHAACSFNPCRHTLDLVKLAFLGIPVFGRKVSLIFPIIHLTVDLKLICINGLSDLINSLFFANIYPGWHNYSLWGLLFQFHGLLVSWLLNFIEYKTCLYQQLLSTLLTYKLHWNYLNQSCQNHSYLLTVQEAHKEYISFTDQIWAKYEQLDSGKYGAVCTLAFNAEACKLSNICLCEPTLPETEPATSKGIIQAHVLQALKILFRSKLQAGSLVRIHGGCSFVCRYVRITGLLSAP